MPSLYTITPIEDTTICDGPAFLPTKWQRVNKLIALNYTPPTRSSDKPYKSLVAHISKLRTKREGERLRIDYTRKKDPAGTDRAQAAHALSAGDISKAVRAAVWGDEVYDLDMDCAHQSFIASAVRADDDVDAEAEFPALLNYVTNKQAERQRVADALYGGDVGKAKGAFQHLTFGGGLRKLYDDATDEAKAAGKDPGLVAFSNEMRVFATYVLNANPGYATKVKRATTLRNKKEVADAGVSADEAKARGLGCHDYVMILMSLWCRTTEATVAERVTKWCVESGVIKDREFDNSKDGLMLPRATVDAWLAQHDTDLDGLLLKFHELSRETGFSVTWSHKDMRDEHTAFWEEVTATCKYEWPEEQRLKFSREFCDSLSEPNEKLAYFDSFFAYVLSQTKVVHFLTSDVPLSDGTHERQRELLWMSDHELLAAYGNIGSGVYNHMGKESPLPARWLQSHSRRTYNKIMTSPYCGPYDPTCLASEDVFNCFSGYPTRVWTGPVAFSDAELAHILDPFLQMTLHLVGAQGYDRNTGRFPSLQQLDDDDKQKYDHLMHLVGHRIVRCGDKKLPYAVLIKSVQGTGKNTLGDILARMVGGDHYKCSANIDDFMGAHAEGLMGRLFVIFNEADISSTAKHKNRSKELISEDKATANPKNVRPFEFALLASVLVFSNEACPIPLDTCGKDRRWVVFEANSWCASMWGEDTWAAFQRHFATDVFLRALRQFLEGLDYSSFNFREAKHTNTQQPAYKKVAHYFVPSEIQFLQHYIENEHYSTFFHDEHYEGAFYENPKWDTRITVPATEMHKMAQKFFEQTHNHSAMARKVQTWNASLTKHGLPLTKTKRGKVVHWELVPRDIYATLVRENWVDDDIMDEGLRAALQGVGTKKRLTAAQMGFDLAALAKYQ